VRKQEESSQGKRTAMAFPSNRGLLQRFIPDPWVGFLFRCYSDPKLADFRDARIKASREDIIASLRGNWCAELLFQVKQELARYEFCQT
jgi:hypothetical protein